MAGNARIQIRRDTAANWTAANPVLALGEIGFETDTNKLKVGNGVATWTALAYIAGGSGGGSWGSITGTLANQTDLNTALNGKAGLVANTFSGTQTAPVIVIGDGLAKLHTPGTLADNNLGLGHETFNTSTINAVGNTAVGFNAGKNITDATLSTFLGAYSGLGALAGVSGLYNTGMGAYSLGGLGNLTTGSSNTGVGYLTAYGLTTGSFNVAIGNRAARNVTTGNNNTFVGYSAGLNVTTGSGNTIIGYNVLGSAALTSTLIIGANGRSDITHDGTTATVTGKLSVPGTAAIGTGTSFGGSFEITSSNLSTSYTVISTGSVLEQKATASGGFISSWDAAFSAYVPIHIRGTEVRLTSGATVRAKTTSTGFEVTGDLTVSGNVSAPNLNTYEHSQTVAATTWTVNHNLGRRPAAVSILSPGYVEVDAHFLHNSANQLTVQFEQAQTGFVRVV